MRRRSSIKYRRRRHDAGVQFPFGKVEDQIEPDTSVEPFYIRPRSSNAFQRSFPVHSSTMTSPQPEVLHLPEIPLLVASTTNIIPDTQITRELQSRLYLLLQKGLTTNPNIQEQDKYQNFPPVWTRFLKHVIVRSQPMSRTSPRNSFSLPHQ